ncbi:MAG: substrate-binding domain-containing protein [Polyangiaceae bacterium]
MALPHTDATKRRGPRTTTVGVLCGEISNGYYEPISRELSLVAREHGVRLITFVERMWPEEVRGVRALTTDLAGPTRLDAVLLLPIGAQLSAQDLAEYVERYRPLPVCAIPDVANTWCSRVQVENESGMRAVITHVVKDHGRRRVGFVRGPDGSDEADLRFRVYREVLAAHGLPFDPALVAPGAYIIQSGVDAVRLFLDERKVELDAIVCANDGMAFGVLDALRLRGIRVPEEMAVVGFDDVDLSSYTEPPLTTARQPLRELARAALTLLLRQLEQGERAEHIVLPSRLVVRDSCGCSSTSETLVEFDEVPRSGDPGRRAMSDNAELTSRAVRALDIVGTPSDNWEARLCQAFVGDVWSTSSEFLRQLRDVLRSVSSARGDIGGFHRVVSMLRSVCMASLVPGSAPQRRADTLLHAARVLISGASERAQSIRQLRFEDFAYKLTQTSNTLGGIVERAAINPALAADLPAYGIEACYLCEYERSDAGELRSRLVASFIAGREPLGSSLSFPAGEVLPEHAFVDGAPMEYVVGPLLRGGSIGYAAFAGSTEEGFVYENLFNQLGGVVSRLRLTEQLMREATLREAAERARLEREFAIAEQIQTSILPKQFGVPGLEIAALMQPSSEVGGDYYDVLKCADGCWIGIGDVAGHGLPTGLVMLMLQSVVSGLVRANSSASPRSVLLDVNSVLYENIRQRMQQDEHVTLTLLRFRDDGTLVFAGGHEDMLVYRASRRECEWIATPGPWVGAREAIAETVVDTEARLEPGDVLVLYTDGITEARSAGGEYYGPERLSALVAELAPSLGVAGIRDGIVRDVCQFMEAQSDDFSVLVAKRPPRQ